MQLDTLGARINTRDSLKAEIWSLITIDNNTIKKTFMNQIINQIVAKANGM